MKTATEMREELAKLYSDLREGKVERKNAKELTNICSKILNSALIQVRYYNDRKESPEIPFLTEHKGN